MKIQLETIDTRYGSSNYHAYSNGNTLPYTGVPFAMNYFLPQTTDSQGAWFFNPTIPSFQGIRLTHQPSPWIGDYAWLLLTPVTGQVNPSSLFQRQSSYRPEEAVFQPHYLKIHSERYQVTTELTASTYGAGLRVTSRHKENLGFFLHSQTTYHFKQVDDYTICGRLEDTTATTKLPLSFYIHLVFDSPVLRLEQYESDYYIELASSQTSIRLGTSYISAELAVKNTPKADFDSLKGVASEAWLTYLHQVDIVDTGGYDRRMFDHALYRLFLFPQTFYEMDANDNPLHINLKTGQATLGRFFTNNGFWDTFRTSFPLFALLAPEKYREFLEGFLNYYKETGYLPKWLAPDERGMMPGTLIDGVIADSCAKGLAPDLQEALFQAMLDTAEKTDPQQIFGRHGAEIYQKLGYLPADFHESVSHTLDYTYSDFCIASVAQALGYTELAETYAKQAQNYRHLFDKDTGYMRARDDKGQFREPFSPYSWGKDYAECSAIQASLSVLHDLDGLKEVMGGEKAFTNYLIRLCQDQPSFKVTGYGYEIHEMSEMARQNLGQLAISNQPSFHIPYLFQESQHPEYTSLIIKSIRQASFQPGFDAYPGDEDNGSMSAWYIFSALGFYPICPGKAEYSLGVPLFNHLRLYLAEKERWLDITCQNNYPHFHFIKDCHLDGHSISKLSHQALLEAQELQFTLSWLPKTKEN